MFSEQLLFIGALLLLISIIITKTFSRLGIPSLLTFLVIGMLAGSEGIGGIYFDDPNLAQFIGIIALTFILFSGGLDTKWSDVKPVLWRGVLLSTLGILITTLSVGFFINWVTGFSLLESLLIGQ